VIPVLAEDVFNGHKVILDGQNKIIPWSVPVERAYDHFLPAARELLAIKSHVMKNATCLLVSA
jgi:hypothetical protein